MRPFLSLIGLATIAHAQPVTPVTSVAIASDGQAVFAGYANGQLRSLDGSMRTQRWVRKLDEAPAQITVSPNGKLLAVAFNARGTWRNVRLYEASTGKDVRALGIGSSVAFSPDGKWIAVGGPGGLLVVDSTTMKVERRFDPGLVVNVAFDPLNQRLAYSAGGRVTVLACGTWGGKGSVPQPSSEAMALGFDHKGGLAISVAKTGQVFRWDSDLRVLPTLRTKMTAPVATSIAPDGSATAFIGIQNQIEVYDLITGVQLTSPRLGGGYANAFSLAANRAILGTLDGQVRWGTRPGTRLEKPPTTIGDAVANLLMKKRADWLSATTVLGSPVRTIQIDLKNPRVKVGVQVAPGFPTGADSFDSLVRSSGATAAITGTFFDTRSLRPIGDIVDRGNILYRGHMGTALAFTEDNEPFMRRVPYGRTQDWSGFETVLSCGPALVLNGEIDVDASGEGFRDPAIFSTTARVGVGFTADQRLLLVATGPLSFQGFAKVMQALDCAYAMNLDAGSSRALYYRGKVLIRPGRPLTNILFVRVE
ncbi:MAG: phosphodiester glycosidase family protein [Chthonomonas sp.]|nr:phosphodiester glycosidase family protein [Chthonomonas sp.]